MQDNPPLAIYQWGSQWVHCDNIVTCGVVRMVRRIGGSLPFKHLACRVDHARSVCRAFVDRAVPSAMGRSLWNGVIGRGEHFLATAPARRCDCIFVRAARAHTNSITQAYKNHHGHSFLDHLRAYRGRDCKTHHARQGSRWLHHHDSSRCRRRGGGRLDWNVARVRLGKWVQFRKLRACCPWRHRAAFDLPSCPWTALISRSQLAVLG